MHRKQHLKALAVNKALRKILCDLVSVFVFYIIIGVK